ncbi:MAG TPA: hypothetical protein VHC22_28440 [Pirellulales bacterium]|nr:hypothetical protein [Pirellulales bacterium]
MPRPRFTLRALLMATLVVAAYFSGVATERHRPGKARPLAAPSPSGALKPGQVLSISDLRKRERALRAKSLASGSR